MKMTKDESMVHMMLEASYKMTASRLAATIQPGTVITKTDFNGSDIRIQFADGRTLLISAINSDVTGKPVIEFEISGTMKKPEQPATVAAEE